MTFQSFNLKHPWWRLFQKLNLISTFYSGSEYLRTQRCPIFNFLCSVLHIIVCSFVCTSSIYDFWLSLWYLSPLLYNQPISQIRFSSKKTYYYILSHNINSDNTKLWQVCKFITDSDYHLWRYNLLVVDQYSKSQTSNDIRDDRCRWKCRSWLRRVHTCGGC